MRQASAISKVVGIIAVVLVAWFGGHFMANVPSESHNEDLLLISVSYIAEEYPMEVKVSMIDEAGDHIYGIIPSQSESFNTLTFEFPYQAHFDSLKVEFETDQPLTVNSVAVTCGAYHKTYRGPDLGTIFYLANSPFTLNLAGELTFVPRGDPATMPGHVRMVPAHDGSQDNSLSISVFLIVAFLLLAVQLTALFIGGVDRFWSVTIGSVVVSVVAVFFMELTRHEVSNAIISVQVNEPLEEDNERVIYYSKNGTFDRKVKLTPDSSGLHQGFCNFQLPSELIRHIRLDFPVKDTIEIEAVIFRCLPLNYHWSGDDIILYFNQLNGVNYSLSKDGSLTLTSGLNDPFIQLSNDEFKSKFEYVQLQRERYPLWLGLLIYLLSILLLSILKVGYRSVYLAVFISVLLVPGLTMVFKSDTYRLETEKRLANQKPVYQGELIKFAKGVSGYLNDQFGGRARLITAWNILRVSLFEQTASSAAVVIGEDDWMYYRAEGVQEAYENKHPFSLDTLNKMARIQQERKDWLALHGIDYYLILPPIKHAMYEEYLPKRIKKSANGAKLDQVLDHLRANTDVDVIDLRDVLYKAKEEEEGPIYYRYDSHWNLRGSFYAYEKIMEVLCNRHPYLTQTLTREEFDWMDTTTVDGDLAKLLSMNEYKLRQDIIPYPKDEYQAETVTSKDYPTYVSIHEVQTREISDADSSMPRLVMSRDSYCNYLIPFLSEHFRRSVYLWTYLFEAEIILEEQPTIYMMEMLERFMKDLTLENPPIVKHELDSARAANQLLKPQTEIVGTER